MKCDSMDVFLIHNVVVAVSCGISSMTMLQIIVMHFLVALILVNCNIASVGSVTTVSNSNNLH